MQVALVDSGRQVGPRTLERNVAARSDATARVQETRNATTAAQSRAATRESAVAPVRGGLRSFDTQFNQRVAASQRTIEFLGRVDAQLQTLRTALSTEIGAGRSEPDIDVAAELSRQIRRFDVLWRERPTATAGSLDSQLDQVEPGTVEQRFKVRGLTRDVLARGEAETLYLAVGGHTQRAVAVVIEPGLDSSEIAQRFDRALAPNGVRVRQDRDGELVFSVRETQWTDTRDVLAIKGDGRRFPTGQFAAARIVPEQPLINPQDWSIENSKVLRSTLQKVTTAHEAVRHARRLAAETLSEEGQTFADRDVDTRTKEGAWSQEFAHTFEATAVRGDYPALSALSSALFGMHRDRVSALLAIR